MTQLDDINYNNIASRWFNWLFLIESKLVKGYDLTELELLR